MLEAHVTSDDSSTLRVFERWKSLLLSHTDAGPVHLDRASVIHAAEARMEDLMQNRKMLSLPARWLRIVTVAATTTLAACVVYEPVPSPQVPSTFERSWNAINGAMADQGVTITEQNFSTGTVRGTRGSVGVLSTVGVQPDGRVRVEINTTGSAAVDPTLGDRIRGSYDRRMGR